MPTKRFTAPERRKQILQAAVKVLARSNYHSARMADIAAQVGISEAAVYKYFPSKKSMYLEIIRHMSQRIITFWQEEVNREPDALKALRNMSLTYFRRMIRHPDELKVQFQAIAEVEDPAIKDQLRQDHQKYIDFIAQVIRKGQEQGHFSSSVDVDTLAWLFDGVGILMNMTNLLSFKNNFNEQAVARITDHLLASMTSVESPPASPSSVGT